MLVSDIEACSFDKWYPKFNKSTIASKILPLSPDIVAYLRFDGGLVLPLECDEGGPEEPQEEDEEEEEEEEGGFLPRPSFPEFNALVKKSIQQLGGKVFCKLNWSSPRDAAWMGVAHSLQCDHPSQVWLLLKSSEFVSHDLTQPFKDCSDVLTREGDIEPQYVLVLRQWSSDLNPAAEFRCFIRNKRLEAICQRDIANYYKHISEEQSDIVRDISTFYSEQVENKFALQNFVMDVVRPAKDVVQLIDFNPFGVTTDALLFEWTELQQGFDHVAFRHVQNQAEVRSSGLRQFSLPRDIVDLASGTDPDKMVDFLQLQTEMQNKEEIKKS